jgi:hypothetical protein
MFGDNSLLIDPPESNRGSITPIADSIETKVSGVICITSLEELSPKSSGEIILRGRLLGAFLTL